MITPAKWQAKGGAKNEQFRKDIVPHMSKIVFYEDETDVFAIKSIGGISYYIINKNNVFYNKYIKNKQDRIESFNNSIIRVYNTKDTLNNFGSTIVEKVKQVSKKTGISFSKYNKNKRYIVSGSNMTGHSNGRGKIGWFSTDANVQVTCKAEIFDTTKESNKSTVAYTLYSSDNIDECKYFNSYIDTKFIRALVMFGVCETGCYNDNNWRFVPDPGPFDHIFTDAELYQKYNLTQEEINIIESVIKERKND